MQRHPRYIHSKNGTRDNEDEDDIVGDPSTPCWLLPLLLLLLVTSNQ